MLKDTASKFRNHRQVTLLLLRDVNMTGISPCVKLSLCSNIFLKRKLLRNDTQRNKLLWGILENIYFPSWIRHSQISVPSYCTVWHGHPSQRPLELCTGDFDLPENLQYFVSWVAIPSFRFGHNRSCFRTLQLKRAICPDSAPGTETGAQALWGDFYPEPLSHATSCLSEVMLSEYPWKTKYKSILRFAIWKQHVLACSAVLIYPENKISCSCQTFSIPNKPLEKQNKKYWITKYLTESEKWSSSCPRSGPKL